MISILILILVLSAIIIALYYHLKKRAYLGKRMILTQQDYTVLFISVPKENEKTPQAAEAMFAALHGIYKSKSEEMKSAIADFVSFEIVAQKNQIKFYIFVPNHLRDFVEGQIYAQYPDIEIQEVEDYAKMPEEENISYAQKFGIPFVDADYDTSNWFSRVKGLEWEPERGKRCTACFDMRFERTALFAAENGFKVITSSLGITRWKDMEQVNGCGVRAANRYPGMVYWTYNWRKKGYQH